MLWLNYQIEKENRIMMKKILRLLLLGLLTVTAFSPSVVTAAENQAVQEASSSVYSEIEEIAPLATPFIGEVTLNHGESYDLTRNIIFSSASYLGVPAILWKIATINGETEAFSILGLSNVPGITFRIPEYHYSNSYEYMLALNVYVPEKPEIRYFGYRLTNYSAGPVTFRVGMNVTYGETAEGLDFDLF